MLASFMCTLAVNVLITVHHNVLVPEHQIRDRISEMTDVVRFIYRQRGVPVAIQTQKNALFNSPNANISMHWKELPHY